MLGIFFSSLLNIISLIGIGSYLFSWFIKKTNSNEENLFLLVSLGILSASTLSIIINLLFPINDYISNVFVIITFLIGINFIKNFKKKNLITNIIFACLISTLLIFKNQNVVDFPVYHSPYISILRIEKIIFGLTSLHFRFGHTSILQNVMALYKIDFFNPNNFQTIIPIFFSAIYIYFFKLLLSAELFRNNFKLYLFNFFIFSYFCIKLYRFNDFGNDALSNLLVFYIWSKFFKFCYTKENSKKENESEIIIIIFLYILCLFNKTSSIFNFIPIFFMFFFIDVKEFFSKNIKFLLVIIFISTSVLSKNFINSGCLFYPIKITCVKTISWASNLDNNLSNPTLISTQSEAWSKDWPNRINKNISQTDYIKEFNWLNTWSKNHMLKVVKKISIYYIYIVLLLVLIFIKFKNIFNLRYANIKFGLIFLSLIPVIIWFLKFPIFRYSSSNIIIFINFTLLYFIKDFIDFSKLFKFFKVNTYFLLSIFILLNIKQVYLNKDNPPWPKINQPDNIKLKKINFNEVTITQSLNDVCYYSSFICTNYKISKNLKIKRKMGYIFIDNQT